jgi:hypothetical protein
MVVPSQTPSSGEGSLAQPPARESIKTKARLVHTTQTKATRYVFGAAYCIDCHRAGRSNDLCRMIEGYFWENRDPHKKAMDWGRGADPKQFGGFKSPAGQRAAEIGQRLGIQDVTKSMRCIGCHSVSIESAPLQSFDPLVDGVTCVACHGPYQEWALQHQLTGDTPWKHKTRREKWENFGMIDLWDPVARAQTCMSCHIGDPAPREGKSITHEIYAAGHPPLPSIEVAAFSEEQPQHWLYLRCKNDKARERLEFNSERLEQTEQVAVSGLVALSRTMEVFEAEAQAPKAKSTWPEFARFDCYPCHHELKSPGGEVLRRARTRGVGRPSAPVWPMALVRVGLDAADPAQFPTRVVELDTRLADFHAALTDRPFGDPEAIAKAARALIEWTEKPLEELSLLASVKQGEHRRVLNRTEAFRLLRRVGEIGSTDLQDYESARQLGWAFRIIDHELREVTTGRPDEQAGLKALATNQPRIQEILKGLDTDLILSLRDRGNVAIGACPPPDQVMAYPTTPDQKPIVGAVLEARLKKLADYDPESFRRRFAELSRLIPVQSTGAASRRHPLTQPDGQPLFRRGDEYPPIAPISRRDGSPDPSGHR